MFLKENPDWFGNNTLGLSLRYNDRNAYTVLYIKPIHLLLQGTLPTNGNTFHSEIVYNLYRTFNTKKVLSDAQIRLINLQSDETDSDYDIEKLKDYFKQKANQFIKVKDSEGALGKEKDRFLNTRRYKDFNCGRLWINAKDNIFDKKHNVLSFWEDHDQIDPMLLQHFQSIFGNKLILEYGDNYKDKDSDSQVKTTAKLPMHGVQGAIKAQLAHKGVKQQFGNLKQLQRAKRAGYPFVAKHRSDKLFGDSLRNNPFDNVLID